LPQGLAASFAFDLPLMMVMQMGQGRPICLRPNSLELLLGFQGGDRIGRAIVRSALQGIKQNVGVIDANLAIRNHLQDS
jgi:hypothetical protein